MGYGKALVARYNEHMGYGKALVARYNEHMGYGKVLVARYNEHMGYGKALVARYNEHMGYGKALVARSVKPPLAPCARTCTSRARVILSSSHCWPLKWACLGGGAGL